MSAQLEVLLLLRFHAQMVPSQTDVISLMWLTVRCVQRVTTVRRDQPATRCKSVLNTTTVHQVQATTLE